MSTTLLLVRHGRASNDFRDYDHLSSFGEKQMEHLAAALVRRGLPDRIWHGSQRRQQASVASLRRAWTKANHPLPETEVLSALDEFDHLPMLGNAGNSETSESTVAQFLEAVQAWVNGRIHGQGERFEDFLSRCAGAVARIAERGPGLRLVVTSGGVVAAAIAARDPDPRSAFLARLRQTETASVTEVVREGGSFRLLRYADTSHLPESLRAIV